MDIPRDENGELYLCSWCRREIDCAECPGRMGERSWEIEASRKFKEYGRKYLTDEYVAKCRASYDGKHVRVSKLKVDLQRFAKEEKTDEIAADICGKLVELAVEVDKRCARAYEAGYQAGWQAKRREDGDKVKKQIEARLELQLFAEDSDEEKKAQRWLSEDERQFQRYLMEKRARDEYYRGLSPEERAMKEAGHTLADFE